MDPGCDIFRKANLQEFKFRSMPGRVAAAILIDSLILSRNFSKQAKPCQLIQFPMVAKTLAERDEEYGWR
jgi:hypothetical protein